MSAFAERRSADLKKVSDLAAQSAGRLKIASTRGSPMNELTIEFSLKTAGSADYPRDVQPLSRIEISLPARYPFQEPTAAFRTPIYHPNVYSSGKVCLGTKWLPSEGLDLLVRRLAQIIIFDVTILNEKSPANGAALTWYRTAKRQNPGAFPTDTFAIGQAPDRKPISWADVSSTDKMERTVVKCAACGTQIRLPTGRAGNVRCPNCGTVFKAAT